MIYEYMVLCGSFLKHDNDNNDSIYKSKAKKGTFLNFFSAPDVQSYTDLGLNLFVCNEQKNLLDFCISKITVCMRSNEKSKTSQTCRSNFVAIDCISSFVYNWFIHSVHINSDALEFIVASMLASNEHRTMRERKRKFITSYIVCHYWCCRILYISELN